MTRREADELIAEWGGVLCPEYEIEVREGPSPHFAANEHCAAIRVHGDGEYLSATLHLGDITADDITDERARQILLHELCHLTLNDPADAGRMAAKGLGHDGQALANAVIERAEERAVDRLATALEHLAN